SDIGSMSDGSPNRRELLADDDDDANSEFGQQSRKRTRSRSGHSPNAKQRRLELLYQREAMKGVYYDGHYRTTPASIVLYRIAAAQQHGGLSGLWAACVALAGHLGLRDERAELTEFTSMDSINKFYIGPRFDPRFAQEFDSAEENLPPQQQQHASPANDGEDPPNSQPLAKGGDGNISLEYGERGTAE
ncbi:hypothetical protein Pmar_PMAR000606, partial [Perkinsus marinus ATCC 50983]